MSSVSSVSGIMSKQMICSGDEVVVYLIIPSKVMGYYLNKGNSSLTSNEGPEVLFSPISLPIFGTCGDFGTLEKIVRDDNVLALEKHLGAKIEDILKRVGDDRESFTKDKKIENVMNYISLAFEHKSIFDKMVLVDKKNRSFEKSDVTFVVLESLGFKQTEQIKGRYYRKYEMEGLENVVVHSDDTFFELIIDGKKKEGIYDLENFLKAIKLKNEDIKQETEMSLYLKKAEAVSKIVIYQEKNPKADEIMEKIRNLDPEKDFGIDSLYHKLFDELAAIEKGSKTGHLTEAEKERNNKYLCLIDSVKGRLNSINKTNIFEQDRKLLENHFHFIAAMWSTSSLFMPTYSGYNDCEASYGKELYQIMEKFVR